MTPVPPMVEKVARALEQADILPGVALGDLLGEWNAAQPTAGIGERTIQLYCRLHSVVARAAIEALMEPTPEMISEGHDAAFGAHLNFGEEARKIWLAMLNAALGR